METNVIKKISFMNYLTKKYVLYGLLFFVAIFIYSNNWSRNISMSEPTTDSQLACKLRKLDPWDVSMKNYFKNPKNIQCAAEASLIYVDLDGFLQFNSSAIAQYSLTSLKCVYHMIRRKGGDKSLTYADAVSFDPPTFIEGRQFRVICKDHNSTIVYDFIHVNIAWNESQVREEIIGPETDEQVSIIFIGLDSVSRSHAIRRLPKSYKYLMETLGSYDFEGFMKVGRNTFPNVIPLLTGLSSETPTVQNVTKTGLDSIPFIWKDMAKTGYTTLYIEDRPEFDTMNYLKAGFKVPPVDYYYRPYALAMRKKKPVILKSLEKSKHCYGNKRQFDLQIDFLKRYVIKYAKRRKFAFFWTNMGHDDFTSVGRTDEPVLDFLHWLKDNGHLERTILIVGSDHGYRMGGASSTYLGRLEGNMPFMSMYLPEVLKTKYKWMHENLLHNTQHLTSHYDVHATMKDIVHTNFVDSTPRQVSEVQQGRSLFNKIPPTRTCKDAGVPSEYCSCYDTKPIKLSYPILKPLANYTVNQLNIMLTKYEDICEKLSLINITNARFIVTPRGETKLKNWNPVSFDQPFNSKTDASGRYVLMLYTAPGQGLFEVVLQYKASNKITIIGDIARVNKYGKQSHCVSDDNMRQFCYCSDLM